MKKMICLILMLFAGGVYGATGEVLETTQAVWQIADSTTSAGTEPSALSVTERTKLLVDAAIAAGASGDDEISIVQIPPKWNALRFRNIGITDGGTVTHQIYLGTLSNGADCEVSHAGQLAWTLGTQQTIYDQIAFTSGGTHVPRVGDTVRGNSSGKTAVIVAISDLSSGAWADGDAAGTITYRSANGTFTNSETISLVQGKSVKPNSDAYTHAASDLIDFEFADTLAVTAKAWGATWTATSPADNTNAEAEIDVKGADYMVIVTTTSSVDSKLLIKGF
jgi:hypothetical protein